MPIWTVARILAFNVVFLALFARPAHAAPSMSDQKNWTEGDKKEFLEFLESGRGAPVTGEVRDVASPDSFESARAPARKPFYLTVEGNTNLTVIRDSEGAAVDRSLSFGPRVLAGGHTFSWVRYYFGLEYHSLSQTKRDGALAEVDHYQVPLGLELALIPLGFPHTQYFILRGSVAAHIFSSEAPSTAFAHPLEGLHLSWNLGLGYEWQIKETGFRFHAIAETQYAFGTSDTHVTSVGLSAGLAYMF